MGNWLNYAMNELVLSPARWRLTSRILEFRAIARPRETSEWVDSLLFYSISNDIPKFERPLVISIYPAEVSGD